MGQTTLNSPSTWDLWVANTISTADGVDWETSTPKAEKLRPGDISVYGVWFKAIANNRSLSIDLSWLRIRSVVFWMGFSSGRNPEQEQRWIHHLRPPCRALPACCFSVGRCKLPCEFCPLALVHFTSWLSCYSFSDFTTLQGKVWPERHKQRCF